MERRLWMALVMAALLPMAIRAVMLVRVPPPAPRVHDEFSFLLGADTLLHGRLANPPHALWEHFETMHVLAQPVYASAFPLGPAALLALGTLLGHAWIGVWVGVGLMCAAVCWALAAAMPVRWAMLGAAMLALRVGITGYWMNSYWGGALAAAGGALLLGAALRMRKRPRARWAALMGAGMMVLANTRTYEGAVFSALVLAWAACTWKKAAWRRAALPLAVSLLCIVAWMAVYSASITGHPLQPPYVLYRTSLSMAPHFVFQSPRPEPAYRNIDLRHYYKHLEMDDYNRARRAPLAHLVDGGLAYWRFYFGPALGVAALFALRLRSLRRWIVVALALAAALLVEVWHNMHYAAPAMALVMLFAVQGLRVLRCRHGRWGTALAWAIPLLCILPALAPAPRGGLARARIERMLAGGDERHLVLVRYSAVHDRGDEWVYNRADIDGAKVVWARELDRFRNARLLDYYRDRRVWLVEPGGASPALIPYERAAPRPMFWVGLHALGPDVRQRLAKSADADMLGCDQWNTLLTNATGFYGPEPANGCYARDRGERIPLSRYWAWLEESSRRSSIQ